MDDHFLRKLTVVLSGLKAEAAARTYLSIAYLIDLALQETIDELASEQTSNWLPKPDRRASERLTLIWSQEGNEK